MNSYILIYTICLILLGFTLILGLIIYSFKYLRRGWTLKVLFKDFARKMWMTMSLGCLFFILYLLGVGISLILVNSHGSDLLFFLHKRTIEFIYLGLWIFALVSLSIYFIRMVIKYFFLTRGKDS